MTETVNELILAILTNSFEDFMDALDKGAEIHEPCYDEDVAEYKRRVLGDRISDDHLEIFASGWKAVEIAFHEGRVEMARMLLDRGACEDHDTDFMSLAIDSGPEMVQMLMDRSWRVNYWDENAFCSHHDIETPIAYAAALGKVEVCRILLDHGANPNYKKVWQFMSAVELALNFGEAGTTRLLLERGATIDEEEEDAENDEENEEGVGSWILHRAIKTGHLGVCKLLLRRGYDPNRKSDFSTYGEDNVILKRPLEYAVEWIENNKPIRLDYINRIGDKETVPLETRKAIALELLRYGALPHSKDLKCVYIREACREIQDFYQIAQAPAIPPEILHRVFNTSTRFSEKTALAWDIPCPEA